MTRINSDGIQALAAIMRAQVQALGRPVATVALTAPLCGEGKANRRSNGEDLAARLSRRVRAIDPSDPDAEGQAIHVFLESVLLAEFGEHLINDPGFHQMVEGVYQQMRANAELAEMMGNAALVLMRK